MSKLSLLFFVLIFIVSFIPKFLALDSKCSDPASLGLDDIQNCLNELNQAKQSSENATTPLINQVNGIKGRLEEISNDLVVKKNNIGEGYSKLAKQQKILNTAIRDFYIKSYYNSPISVLLSTTSSAQSITQILAYQKAAADQDKQIITGIALSIQSLENQKANLESEEKSLASAKISLDKIIADAKTYQSSLSNQISALSAKQQQILSARLASLNIPLSAYTTQGGCSSDLTNGKDPGFSGAFGFFTYGVPNRVGLNQYGAKARAEAGQSAESILQAYYNADLNKGYDTGINIHVTGNNEYGQSFDTNWNIEDYVKHIYEMPTSWNMEALKAQAVAARSYALSYTNNGSGSICPSQSCQVVKQELNSDAWQQAVDATRGWVLTNGGAPIKAWFSSTHGGYIFSSGDIGWSATSWTKSGQDTTGGVSNFSDLNNNAYDKSSPWFYCDWGGRSSYGGTAWMTPQEAADIANVLMLVQKDGGTKEHVYQVDKPNPAGTDTWDADRVKQELKNRGGNPFNSLSGISVSADFGRGVTTGITVSGDAGSVNFSGSDFKTYFNLRAPANINIVGPLYNVERK